MKQKANLLQILTLLFYLVQALLASPQAVAQSLEENKPPTSQPYLLGTSSMNNIFIPPKQVGYAFATGTRFEIVYREPNGDDIMEFPAEAREAFDYAANHILASLIISPVPIQVDAVWKDLGGPVNGSVRLGGARPVGYLIGSVQGQSTLFPNALVDAITGSDQSPGSFDITSSFTSNKAAEWYFGVDGKTPSAKRDFVTVVLHELLHGLGFSGSMIVDDGDSQNGVECDGIEDNGCWGLPLGPGGEDLPLIYDYSSRTPGGVQLIDTDTFPVPSNILGLALQFGSIFWDDPLVWQANMSDRVELYSPDPWEFGRSHSHLDNTQFPSGSSNSLMGPDLGFGSAIHNPGRVPLSILQSMGWPVALAEVKLSPSDGDGFDDFGSSADVADQRLIVGARKKDGGGVSESGAAYIFRRDGDLWSEEQKIVPNDPTLEAEFGISVSIYEPMIAVGAYLDNDLGSKSGSVYVFSWNGESWQQIQKLVASDGGTNQLFGHSTSLYQDTLVVGAPSSQTTDPATYIFRWNGSSWVETQKLLPNDVTPGSNFGRKVKINRDFIVVGDWTDSTQADAAGAVYIYEKDGNLWKEKQKIVASNGSQNSFFGKTLALDGDIIVVGAPGFSGGSAYVFRLIDSTWVEQQELTISPVDLYGYSVAVRDNLVLVGAGRDDQNGTDAGAAYLFQEEDGKWMFRAKLLASDGRADDTFAKSALLITDDLIVAGANTDFENRPGAFYIFERNRVLSPSALFEDSFENGDTSTWSLSFP